MGQGPLTIHQMVNSWEGTYILSKCPYLYNIHSVIAYTIGIIHVHALYFSLKYITIILWNLGLWLWWGWRWTTIVWSDIFITHTSTKLSTTPIGFYGGCISCYSCSTYYREKYFTIQSDSHHACLSTPYSLPVLVS